MKHLIDKVSSIERRVNERFRDTCKTYVIKASLLMWSTLNGKLVGGVRRMVSYMMRLRIYILMRNWRRRYKW